MDQINLHRIPEGSTIEHRDDGRVFVWYPPLQRETVSFTGLDRCKTCGVPVGHPERDMRVANEELGY